MGAEIYFLLEKLRTNGLRNFQRVNVYLFSISRVDSEILNSIIVR